VQDEAAGIDFISEPVGEHIGEGERRGVRSDLRAAMYVA
jgi:hypothetical protein